MRTSVPHIYAWETSSAARSFRTRPRGKGCVAAENIAGLDSVMRYDVIPWAIFMQPEIAGVGLTRSEGGRKGHRRHVRRDEVHGQ